MRHFVLAAALVAAPAFGSMLEHGNGAGFVNDSAGILSTEQRSALESRLRAVEASTKVEIAVVTVNSLDGLPVEDYAQQLWDKWGIGKKGVDTGVLLLMAPNERKVRIQTGYGTEEALPDITCQQIIADKIRPAFRAGDPAGSLLAGVDGIEAALRRQPLDQPKHNPTRHPFGWIVLVLLLAAVVVFSVVAWMRAEQEREREAEEEERKERFRQQLRESMDRLRLSTNRLEKRYVVGAEPVAEESKRRLRQAEEDAERDHRRRQEDKDSSSSSSSSSWGFGSGWGGGSDSGSSSGGGFDFGGGSSGGGGASGDL